MKNFLLETNKSLITYCLKPLSKVKLLLFVSMFCSVFVNNAQAGIRQYSASINTSQWLLANDSRLQCTLAHQIPHYGQARFSATASRKLNMECE